MTILKYTFHPENVDSEDSHDFILDLPRTLFHQTIIKGTYLTEDEFTAQLKQTLFFKQYQKSLENKPYLQGDITGQNLFSFVFFSTNKPGNIFFEQSVYLKLSFVYQDLYGVYKGLNFFVHPLTQEWLLFVKDNVLSLDEQIFSIAGDSYLFRELCDYHYVRQNLPNDLSNMIAFEDIQTLIGDFIIKLKENQFSTPQDVVIAFKDLFKNLHLNRKEYHFRLVDKSEDPAQYEEMQDFYKTEFDSKKTYQYFSSFIFESLKYFYLQIYLMITAVFASFIEFNPYKFFFHMPYEKTETEQFSYKKGE